MNHKTKIVELQKNNGWRLLTEIQQKNIFSDF